MNITELRCSACNGTLKVDKENPNVAVCEYCHTKFMIEWSRPGIHGQQDIQLRQMPQKIAYQPIEPKEPKKTGWEPYGWKRGVALVILFFVIFGVWKGPAIYRRYQMDHQEDSAKAAGSAGTPGTDNDKNLTDSNLSDNDTEEIQLTGLLAAFAEFIFDKPLEDITSAELSKIQWLELSSSIDFRRVGYSFDDPQENPDAQLTWVEFPRDDYRDADLSCLPAFSGLKRIETSQTILPEYTKGLSLTGIGGYYDSLETVAAIVEDPSRLRYISVTSDPISLAGLEQLTGLETLILDGNHLEEEKNLVNAKSLKHLTVDMYDGTMDFSTFGMMPWLESLDLRSPNVRDLGFVAKMDALTSLSLEDGAFLNLEPLRERPQLTELSLESCDELNDMSAVSVLTNLTKLKLELPYKCPQPDLSSLAGLTELYLDSFDDTSFLCNMTELETLTLDSTPAGSASDFNNLTKLKTLKCTAFIASEQDYSFITHLPALEEANLQGTVTYSDISGIFNMPTLKRLNISNMQCEINFNHIEENTTLEVLAIDKIKLYNNVKVSGGGGIVYVDWDDVSFTENLAFLEKFKGLKELSIRENELTEIGFATALEGLQKIDFSDNYVTDVSALSGLKALAVVNCSENPVSNADMLGDKVMVIQ